mmetsp:Transcript_20323/g.56603  ORF Transcript_20323/g.56603 Transcript_20323/m.56603 type:complete len:147 (-) Transcript_20323:250-690(-)
MNVSAVIDWSCADEMEQHDDACFAFLNLIVDDPSNYHLRQATSIGNAVMLHSENVVHALTSTNHSFTDPFTRYRSMDTILFFGCGQPRSFCSCLSFMFMLMFAWSAQKPHCLRGLLRSTEVVAELAQASKAARAAGSLRFIAPPAG